MLLPAMDFETLSRWADEELKALIKALPDDVRDAAGKVPVSMEQKPGLGMFDDELEIALTQRAPGIES